MKLKDALNAISNDFGSTFSLISDHALANILSDSDLPEVEEILVRHLGPVEVRFEKTGQMSKEHSDQDIWIIKIS